MQKFAVLAFVLLSATACSKKGGDGNACDGSIKHLISLQGAELKDAPPEMKAQMESMMTTVSNAMIKSCVDTKWSKEVTDCLAGAKKIDDAKPCEEKLTPEQKTASDKAAEEAMKSVPPPAGMMKKKEEAPPAPTEGSAAPAPTPTEGSAAAPAGSADGSAAAPEAK